jgi:hypothetical protein
MFSFLLVELQSFFRSVIVGFSHAKDSCLCNDDQYIVISRVNMSRIVLSSLIIVSALFVAGYFLGKKSGVELFSNKIVQESFADQIYYAASTRYEASYRDDNVYNDSLETFPDSKSVDMESPEECSEKEHIVLEAAGAMENKNTQPTLYQAQLLGGTLKNAQAFALTLQRKGIDARVIERISNSLKNTKKVIWYQVVLELDDRKKLEQLVEMIKQSERIDKVSIIELL